MATKTITIKDVARKAGVSVATVSAVVNEKTKKVSLSDVSREKVLQAIKKLNYKVNTQARMLRTGRSNTFGVIASDITQPFSGLMIRVIEAEANKRNYHFMILDIQNIGDGEQNYVDMFSQKHVEGVLFIGTSNERDSYTVSSFIRGGVPVVLTECEDLQHKAPCVLVDNLKGAFTATNHLAQLGHKVISHISGPRGNLISEQRCQGFIYGLSQNGLGFSSEQIVPGGLGLEEGYEAMKRLLSFQNRPDAVFAFNDMTAIGAMRAIAEAGLRIPQDIAIVGFDDLPVAAYIVPSLTTVKQPVDKMCGTGVSMLLDILDGKCPRDYYNRVVLELELVVRESCGGLKK